MDQKPTPSQIQALLKFGYRIETINLFSFDQARGLLKELITKAKERDAKKSNAQEIGGLRPEPATSANPTLPQGTSRLTTPGSGSTYPKELQKEAVGASYYSF
jgi:hypothetical protein